MQIPGPGLGPCLGPSLDPGLGPDLDIDLGPSQSLICVSKSPHVVLPLSLALFSQALNPPLEEAFLARQTLRRCLSCHFLSLTFDRVSRRHFNISLKEQSLLFPAGPECNGTEVSFHGTQTPCCLSPPGGQEATVCSAVSSLFCILTHMNGK